MRTPKLLIIMIIISGLILIGSIGIGLYTSNEIKNRTDMMSQINDENIKHHIMMILNDADETYSDAFYEGVKATAKANNIAVETIMIGENNYLDEVLDRLDMAMYAKVDGIILHAYDHEAVIEKINQASEMGIPVVTLNESLHLSKRITYAGNNRFSIGINVGKTIADITSGRGSIAVIDRMNYGEATSINDLLGLGLQDALDSFDDLELVLKRHTEQGVLSAETIATDILDNYPEIDSIYCSDAKSTLGLVQVLIDRNRVSDFTVIGYGDDHEILQYIKSGVIDATIVTDDEAVGVAAVTAIYDYFESGIVKTEFLPSIIVVDKNNVDAFIKEMEAADEN